MPEPADPIAAVVTFLLADSDTAALAGARMFGGELPANAARRMPETALMVRESGGASITGSSFAGFDAQRIDLFTYGKTPREASLLMRTATLALRALQPGVWANTLLHSCNPAGGAASGREPQTEWPRCFASFQILFALEQP